MWWIIEAVVRDQRLSKELLTLFLSVSFQLFRERHGETEGKLLPGVFADPDAH
jgi:hypothetical protein